MRDKWYPFPEQAPPSEREFYLVTLDTGRLCIAEWIDFIWFGHRIPSEWHWAPGDIPQYCKVIAWRPAPEAYVPTPETKEESDDEAT